MFRRGPEGQGPASWQEVHAAFRRVVEAIPRTATRVQIEEAADLLSQLADDIRILLETQVKATIMDANKSQTERHIQKSNPKPFVDLEPASERGGGGEDPIPFVRSRRRRRFSPLGMVLDACPDLADYAKGGICNWRDFLAAAAVVRPMLGISPSAWDEARNVMGELQAAVVVACILSAGFVDPLCRGLPARVDAEGVGRRVFDWADLDGADQFADEGKAFGLNWAREPGGRPT